MAGALTESDASSMPDRKEAPPRKRIVTHKHLGVWDYYEELDPDVGHVSAWSRVEKNCAELVECLPYVVRMFKEVLSIPGCPTQLVIYAATEVASALIPALSLWFQGQLVQMMETTLSTGTIDARALLQISAGRLACTFASIVLQQVRTRAHTALNARVRRHFARATFRASARLDVPTFARPDVQSQLLAAGDHRNAAGWQVLRSVAELGGAAMKVGAQGYVLLGALGARGRMDGLALAGLSLAADGVFRMRRMGVFGMMNPGAAWAISTKNEDYVKMQAWRLVVQSQEHRKEFVAGDLAEFATEEFSRAADAVGDMDDGDWIDMHMRQSDNWLFMHFNWLFREFITNLPQIAFTARAILNPSRVPGSLAELNQVQNATSGFAWAVQDVVNRWQSLATELSASRQVYEVENIPNLVLDGTVSFSEDGNEIRTGVALEFRNVSFKYPDAKRYALRNVSFRLLPRQLCVIVGSNGAGKSTILKLAVRLYDPDEGQIFFGGHDIRTLKLRDLRQAISVLFQDYTHFPLSIRDNIAIGDPSKAGDDEHVRLAARLGGAESFIEKLPEGFGTYLQNSVSYQFGGPPEGNKTVLGNAFDTTAVCEAAGIKSSRSSTLSGGQMQRLAVARTFMRSVVADEEKVGLLLFDEPSASLDPAAEHDLFDRLRELRRSKTMVFSSHRFGNLTRHADLILYMDDSGIAESGSHDDLLQRPESEYARLWKLQAQAFVA